MKKGSKTKGVKKVQPLEKKGFKFEEILSSAEDHISIIDRDLNIVWANNTVMQRSGPDAVGKKCYAAFHKLSKPCVISSCPTLRAFKDGKAHCNEKVFLGADGNVLYCAVSAKIIAWDDDGAPRLCLEVTRDITKVKLVQDELAKMTTTLEMQVKRRTEELSETVENLRNVISEHDTTLESLRSHKLELEQKSQELEDANIALRVMLKKRDQEKSEFDTEIIANIIRFVLPYLDGLKKTGLTDRQKSFISLIEANLETVISPQGASSIINYAKLTPTELRVANFIKQGKSTKEIAQLMNISSRTVETHRDHIRKKFGISKKRESLRKILLSRP